MNKISFVKNGTEVTLSSDGVLSLYIKLLEWLDKNGYDFKGKVHNQFVRKVFNKEELDTILSNSTYSLSNFYNINNSGKYIFTAKGNINDRLKNIILILKNFGIDESTIKTEGFESTTRVKKFIDFETSEKSYSFIEAAQVILKQNGNKPMTSSDIWSKISEKNLVKTAGKTPAASLNSIMLRASDNGKTKNKYGSGKKFIFRITDFKPPYKFILINPNDEVQSEEDFEEIPNVYCVRAGQANKDADLFIEGNFVGISYDTQGFDISVKSKEEILQFLSSKRDNKRAIQQYIQQIELFKEIQEGDIILVPDSDGTNIGEVSSEMYLTEGEYPNRINVEWIGKIEKNSSLNIPKTVFRVNNFDTNDLKFTDSEPEFEVETVPEVEPEPIQKVESKAILKADSEERSTNPFRQCICILGDPGVGKSVTAIETIEKDLNHKFYLSIPTDLSTSMLVQFVKGELVLNKISKMIINAYKNPNINYTVLIDEFHKPLTIKRVNDELLQGISTKRYRGRRFISSEIAESFISEELDNSGFSESDYSFHGNIEIPRNFGFVLLSSKPNVIVDNDDLYDRMDIVYLREKDQGQIDSIKDLLNISIKSRENKSKFKQIIKSQDKDRDDQTYRETLDDFLDNINEVSITESHSSVLLFNNWRKL